MINLSSRNLELIIGSQDWTDWLDADSGIQVGYPEYGVGTGLLPVEGTITLKYAAIDPSLPSSPIYRTNPNQWRRGQQLSIRIANSLGALTYLPCSGMKLYITKPPQRPKRSMDGTETLVLQIGCRLALEYFPPEPNRDVSGVIAGVERNRGAIITSILNYISVPSAIGELPYGIAYPLPKVTGNWLQMCGQLADSAGYHLRCDVNGTVISVLNNLDLGGVSASYLIGRDEEIWEAIGDIAEQPIEKLTVTGINQVVGRNPKKDAPKDAVVIEEAPIGVVLPDVGASFPQHLMISKKTTTTSDVFDDGNRVQNIILIEEPIGVVLPDVGASFPQHLTISKETTTTWAKQFNGTWTLTTLVEEPIGVALPDAGSSFPQGLTIASKKTEENAIAPSADLVEPISENIITEVQLKSEVTAQQLANDGRARQRTIDVPFAVSESQLTKYGQNYNKFLSGRCFGWRLAGEIKFLEPFSQVSVTDENIIYLLKLDAIQYAINQQKAYCLWHGIEVGTAYITTPSEISRPVTITMGNFEIIGTSSGACLFEPFAGDVAIGLSEATGYPPFAGDVAIGLSSGTGYPALLAGEAIGLSEATGYAPFFVEPTIGLSSGTADPPIFATAWKGMTESQWKTITESQWKGVN